MSHTHKNKLNGNATFKSKDTDFNWGDFKMTKDCKVNQFSK